MIEYFYYLLIVPGFLFTAAAGLVSTWIDRKVSARVQWRQGPPWYQPFADVLKLLGKETFLPGSRKTVFILAPLLGLIAVPAVSTMLWYLNINAYANFKGGIVIVLLLLAMPSISLIIGGSLSKNPLSALGARREMRLFAAYEVPFVIAVATAVMKAGSVSNAAAFIVALIVAQAQLGFAPFETTEAEQEIESGPLLEYSGKLLAAFKLTKAMMLYALPLLLITLFLGGVNVNDWTGGAWFILKYFAVVVLFVLVKNTNPRIRIDQAVRFFRGPVTLLAVVGFILAVMGR
jgi:NADH-quinone oxidoreductase subunit H